MPVKINLIYLTVHEHWNRYLVFKRLQSIDHRFTKNLCISFLPLDLGVEAHLPESCSLWNPLSPGPKKLRIPILSSLHPFNISIWIDGQSQFVTSICGKTTIFGLICKYLFNCRSPWLLEFFCKYATTDTLNPASIEPGAKVTFRLLARRFTTWATSLPLMTVD